MRLVNPINSRYLHGEEEKQDSVELPANYKRHRRRQHDDSDEFVESSVSEKQDAQKRMDKLEESDDIPRTKSTEGSPKGKRSRDGSPKTSKKNPDGAPVKGKRGSDGSPTKKDMTVDVEALLKDDPVIRPKHKKETSTTGGAVAGGTSGKDAEAKKATEGKPVTRPKTPALDEDEKITKARKRIPDPTKGRSAKAKESIEKVSGGSSTGSEEDLTGSSKEDTEGTSTHRGIQLESPGRSGSKDKKEKKEKKYSESDS